MLDTDEAAPRSGRSGFTLPQKKVMVMRRVLGLVVAGAITIALSGGTAFATNPPAIGGGGDGGNGATTPPGTTQCYMSFGKANAYGLDISPTMLTASLNFTYPNNVVMTKIRFTSNAGDGSTSYDSGWMDQTFGDNEIWYDGQGQPGTITFSHPDNNNSLDISGGTTLEAQFQDQNGDISFAEGETYPPDPATGQC